jgi:predicted ATPase
VWVCWDGLVRPHDVLLASLYVDIGIPGSGKSTLAMSLLRFVSGYAQLFVFIKMLSGCTYR